MLIRCGFEMTLGFAQPTPVVALVSVEEKRQADLRGGERIMTSPAVPLSSYRDIFGNRCLRFVAPGGDLTVRGDLLLSDSGQPDPVLPQAREVPVAELPDECLNYLMGSRYCETDRLSQVAWDTFGHIAPGWARVQAICDFVHDYIHFDYQQACATRTALEAYTGRVGVCRDFTHLAMTFCRCLNIPARYVNGYLGDIGVPPAGPMDFSAWMEVFLDGAWYSFDPRNNASRIGRVIIARGRDAADVPMINSFGPHILKSFQVWSDEVRPSQPSAAPVTAMRGSAPEARSVLPVTQGISSQVTFGL